MSCLSVLCKNPYDPSVHRESNGLIFLSCMPVIGIAMRILAMKCLNENHKKLNKRYADIAAEGQKIKQGNTQNLATKDDLEASVGVLKKREELLKALEKQLLAQGQIAETTDNNNSNIIHIDSLKLSEEEAKLRPQLKEYLEQRGEHNRHHKEFQDACDKGRKISKDLRSRNKANNEKFKIETGNHNKLNNFDERSGRYFLISNLFGLALLVAAVAIGIITASHIIPPAMFILTTTIIHIKSMGKSKAKG